MPRGYVVLTDIYTNSEAGSIKAHYTNYEPNYTGGTHYYSTYNWDSNKAEMAQLTKLRIPKADWDYGKSILLLMIDLVHQSYIDLETTIRNYNVPEFPVKLVKSGEKATFTQPKSLIKLNITSAIRDFIFSLTRDEDYDFPPISLREIKSLIEELDIWCYENLDRSHPIYIQIKNWIDLFDSE